MKPHLAWWLLPATFTAALFILATEARWSAAPTLQTTAEPLNCQQQDQVQTGYMIDSSAVQQRPGLTLLSGESWLEVQVCRPGTLVLTGSGDLAGTELPRLQVMNGNQILSVVDFTGVIKTVRIPILTPGRLRLIYLNDFHADETRTLTLKDFQLRDTTCPLNLQVPVDTGGQLYANGLITLLTGRPMKLTACRATTLNFRMRGQAAGGQFPAVEISQGESPLKLLPSTSGYVRQTVNVQPGEVQIRLKDPYRAVLSDRNIRLQTVQILH